MTAAFMLLLFTSSTLSNSSIVSFLGASAQSASVQDNIDDRINQRLQYSQKLREASGERVPNQYIVVLKDSAISPNSVVQQALEARNQGAELRHIYQYAIRGYAVRVPNQEVLDSILSNPAVDYVQPDQIARVSVQDLPTGVNRVDGDLSSTKSGDGAGSVDNVNIAILDTGIDLDHPDLNVYKEKAKTFVLGTTTAQDDNGHGTKVAGLAAAKDNDFGVVGTAPGARLWAIKVLNSKGFGSTSEILKGVDYVTANFADIDTVNMSIQGNGTNEVLEQAINNSTEKGLTYVVAAGNYHDDAANHWPAGFDKVITVSAIVDTDGKCGGSGDSTSGYGWDDDLASFSNFGKVVDIAAPGVRIETTALGGSYTTGNHFSGTSASAPLVTGAAALYKSRHTLESSPSQIRDALVNSGSTSSILCDGKGHGGFIDNSFDGIPEPLLYMASDSTPVDNTAPTVTSTDPKKDVTGVVVDTLVKATFSEPVLPSTVSTSTFTLNTANSPITSIQGKVTLENGNTVVTFDPTTPNTLAAGTKYTAKLSGVKDSAGNQMADYSWSFTTAAPSSSTCNTNLPISGATSSPTQTGYTANNAIDNSPTTFWWSTLSVNPWIKLDLGSSKSICSVDIAWADQRQYTFKIEISTDGSSFSSVFSGKRSGTTTSPQKYSFAETSARYVRITITEIIVGSSNSIAQISELDVFGTSGAPPPPPVDNTPPTVTSTSPSGGTGIPIPTFISGTFSEAVLGTTVSTTTFSLKAGSAGTNIPGTVTLSSGNIAKFTPASPLAASTSYTATIKGGTNGVKDLAGNFMTADYSWSFTTAAPSSSTCNTNLPISGATSSPTQTGYAANNAIDNSPTTIWWSTFSVNPWIKLDLGSSKSICSVDIAWADQRQYTFKVEISTDGSSYTTVFSGKSSGTSTSAQKYSFAETSARYVKITITQSRAGSSLSLAQISELDVFGKAGTSGISRSSPDDESSTKLTSHQSTEPKVRSFVVPGKGDKRDQVNSSREAIESNLGPIAKDDRAITESNTPVIAKVLLNDNDPDGDELKVISVSDSKHGAIITINKNGTITFLPSSDFAGRDTFTYTIADGKGKLDKAKVSINVMQDREQIRQIDKQDIVEQNQLTTDNKDYYTDERAHELRNQGDISKNMKVPDTPTAYQSESTLSTEAEASKGSTKNSN
jgi:subtilisin family serine protease